MLQFGLTAFRDALLRVIRDPERPSFFPDPNEIRRSLEAAARTARDRALTEREMRRQAEWKAQWERERAEDAAEELAAAAVLSRAHVGAVDLTDGLRRATEFRQKMREADPEFDAKVAAFGKPADVLAEVKR